MFARLLAAAAASLFLLAAHARDLRQASGPAVAPPDADIGAVLARYATAWYEGNTQQLATTLHPEFQHRTLRRAPGKPDALEAASGLAWIDAADRGGGRTVTPTKRRADVRVLGVDAGIAAARLTLADRIELVQLARWNNQWRIVDVLATPAAPAGDGE